MPPCRGTTSRFISGARWFVLVIGLFAGPVLAQSQPGVWQNHGPTGIIDVENLLAQDTDPPTLFASALGGLAISYNGGISWIAQKQPAHYVFAVGTRVFAMEGGRISYSDDGSSWQNAVVPELFFQFGDLVSQIIASGSTLLAATGQSGVLSSQDGGTSWIPSTLPENVDRINVILAGSDRVYAGTGRVFLSAPAFGLFHSDDQGQTWVQADAPMDSLEIRALLVAGNTVFVGTQGHGLFHLGDGQNWQQSPPPLADKDVAILFSAGDTLVYAGFSDGGVVFTADFGQTWQPAPAPISTQKVRTYTSVDSVLHIGTADNGTFHSHNGSEWTQAKAPMDALTVNDLSAAGQTLYAATVDEGIFRSEDGLNWIPVADLTGPLFIRDMLLDDKFMIAASSSGVFRSVDGGVNWVTANPPMDILDVRSVIHFNDILLATTVDDGVFLSLEGLNWRQADPPIGDQLIRPNLEVDGTLYLGSFGSGVFSSNDGLSWTSTNPAGFVASLLYKDGALYAGSVNQGLYRSIDGGGSWNLVDSPMNGMTIFKLVSINHTLLALAFDNVTLVGDIIIPFSDAQLYRSPDGLSWTELAIPAPANQVRTFLALQADLFLGYAGSGTMISRDGGNTWESLTAPWDRFPMQHLIEVDNAIFAGAAFFGPQAAPGGVYRSLDHAHSWTPLNKDLSLLPGMSGLEYFPILDRLYLASGGISYQDVDFVPPEAQSLSIANEASYTSKQLITVFAEATDADSIALSEDEAFPEPLWRKYSQLPKVLLSEGDGLKTIYAKFKDFSANESETLTTQIVLDQSPPVFQAHTVPGDTELGQAVTITQVVTDDNLESVELFYRHPGDAFTRNRSVVFDGNTATIDSLFVNNKGLDYRIIATDLAGQSDTLRNGDLTFFSLPIILAQGELGSSPGFPGGIGGNAYRLLSVPMELDGSPNVTEVLGNLGTYGIEGDWIFWHYLGGGQWQQGRDVALQTGASYFILLRDGRTFTNEQPGSTMATSAGIIGEIPGWHVRGNDWTLIGNPYNGEIDLRFLRLARQNLSLDVRNQNLQVWAYDGRDESNGWTNNNLSLETWGGLAIFSQVADTVVFSNPRDPIGPPPGADPAKATASRQSQVEGDWQVRVVAEAAGFSDRVNGFGTHHQAKAGWDALDWFEPPRLPGGVSVRFVQPLIDKQRTLALDMRPPLKDGHIWQLEVVAAGGAMVRLNFDLLELGKRDVTMRLIDPTTGLVRDLRVQPEITFRMPQSGMARPFRIVAGQADFVAQETQGLELIPSVFNLGQNYPNPFNPVTVIRYELPVAGEVSLRIFDVLGQEIATLIPGKHRVPGSYEAVADMRDMASGVYFYQLIVTGEERFHQTRKMLLLK